MGESNKLTSMKRMDKLYITKVFYLIFVSFKEI